MSFYVYILQSQSTGRLYIGDTSREAERLAEHQAGQTKSTRGRGPWKRIYVKQFKFRSETVRHERWLKSLKRPKYILQHIAPR